MRNEKFTINNVKSKFFNLLFVTCYLLFVSGCSNLFDPLRPTNTNGSEQNGMVRIYIGDDSTQSRTVQPGQDAIVGYQLTFGDRTHDPVKVTGSNYADVTLADGNWTITATAYKKNGIIGNEDDAVASGSILITLTNGAVSGDIPPIILRPLSTAAGSGTLHYDITVKSGASGFIKLSEINGTTPIDVFGEDGVVNLTDSADDDFSYTAGRYIIEVKLTDGEGNIALRREVVEIWQNTTTSFTFAPAAYIDPNAVLANSTANLSETDTTVNGNAIGAGLGSGVNEQNPKTYAFSTTDAENVSITLVFEVGSLNAAISWALNTGAAPGGVYSEAALPSTLDFSTNNILWIRAVPEDGGAPMYYMLGIEVAIDYGNFNVVTVNASGVSYSGGTLSVIDNGAYTISMKSGVTSTNREKIVVASGVNADIILSGVNIDVRGTGDTCAFDMTSATVNLTLVGTNVLRSGDNLPGLRAPAGATLVITAASTGSLEATGGHSGAGIGGGNNSAGGTITINGGVVTATGGNYASGIGGGSYSAGGAVTINGGTVTATSFYNGGGISGTINISNNAVVIASSMPALTAGVNVTNSLVLNGDNGMLYGNVTLSRNVTIPSGKRLAIINDDILRIESGYTLTNNGAIYIADANNIEGTVDGNQPILFPLKITGGYSYTYASNILTITGNGTYVISMKEGVTSTDSIVVNSGVNADITLSYVNISSGGCAFNMDGATVNLTLVGTNVLSSGNLSAGINAPTGSTLVITSASTGSLNAIAGSSSAGIGGSYRNAGGRITISGGTVTATGGGQGSDYLNNNTYGGAGIGGGSSGAGGTVTINGGTVTAIGNTAGFYDERRAWGIGCGYQTLADSSGGGTINISNNSVVFARIQPTLTEGVNVSNSIVNGTMYGDVTLNRNVTIPSNIVLSVKNGQTLRINNGYALANNGTILIDNESNIVGTVTGNPPVLPLLIVSGGSSYTYTGRTLTINGSDTYTISMRTGVTSTAYDRIVVAPGVNANITLSGVNIDNGDCAFDMTGATVNLTLIGTNILKSGTRAGLQAPDGATLVITAASTGSLEATGGLYYQSDYHGGAGIGGSDGNAGGTITINGGTVTATGYADGGAGIGGGRNGAAGTISISSNAVVIASSIQATLTEGVNVSNAIVFNGNTGTMYGNVTLNRNVTIPSGRTLAVSDGQSLVIGNGYTLTNNGTVWVPYNGNFQGTVEGNQPWPALTISGGSSFTYVDTPFTSRVLTITGDGTYTIGMRSGITSTTVDRIAVASGVTANITLSGVNIDVSATNNACAFDMTGATVNLTLNSTNVLKSGHLQAGLQAPDGATLVITAASTGSLEAIGGNESGAGIGGGDRGTGGSITINGGTVVATGGYFAAGIGGGGGNLGTGSMITINGGTVTATGGQYGAGIGGGIRCPGRTITISGGTITATGGREAAGIGGGSSGGAGGTITINGGTVTATGGVYGCAGIGGGSSGAGGTISISGGTVTATGGSDGVGIGGGSGGAGGTVTISGGTVTATGNNGSAGIGGGRNSTNAGTIDISNNAVVIASSIRTTLTEGDNVNDAIVFIDNTGTLYGTVTLAQNVTFTAGRVLTIASGKSLTIPGSVTLTNNGTINVQSGGTVTGTVTGNQPVQQ